MGGEGSGRKPDPIKQLLGPEPVANNPIDTGGMYIPNLSGDHSRGKVISTPSQDLDIPNKKYVDDAIDTDITTHTAIADAHHAKYTDAEAVSAVATADDYLKNDGDTATGDYNFDSNTLVIDSTNDRVGIGTASPATPLEVTGSNADLIRVTDATDSNKERVALGFVDGSGGYVRIRNEAETENVLFRSYGDSFLLGGNVGIGTSNPLTNFQVAGDFANDNGYGQIEAIGSTNNAKRLTMGFDTTNNLGWIQASETSVAFRDLILQPNGANVGIGTSSPIEKLSVGANNEIFFNANTINSYGESTSDSASMWLNYEGYQGSNTKYRDLTIGDGKNNAIAFFDGSSGNVGIGTASPSNTLHVAQTSTSGRTMYVHRDLAAASTDNVVMLVHDDNAGDDQGALGVRQDGTGYILRLLDGATTVFEVSDGGAIMVPNIPTSDPEVAGQVWSNGGVLTVSAGA